MNRLYLMLYKKKDKVKNRNVTSQKFILWVFGVVFALISFGWLVSLDVQHAYVDAFPFYTNWYVVGEGHITKSERNSLLGKGRKNRHYQSFSFAWYFNNSEKKYEGKCFSYDLNFNVGNKVTIVAYKRNPHNTKIIGTYVTTTLPSGVYFAFFPVVILFIFWIFLYKIL